MMRHLLAALAALALASCTEGSSRDWPAPSPALWEATAPSGETGWLFGTVHALPDGVKWRTPALEAALAEAQVLIVEIADLDAPEGEQLFRDLSESPDQGLLLRRTDPADREAVGALIERAGFSSGDFRGIETWAAAIYLANAVREGDPANGVDRALIAGVSHVEGLEDFRTQFRLFDALPEAEQADLLAGIARESAVQRQDAGVLAWLTGDNAALLAQAREDGGILTDPELREALLTARNRRWLPRIAAAIEDRRKPFVAVGSLHLLGEDGLVAMLAAQGYTLRRIQ